MFELVVFTKSFQEHSLPKLIRHVQEIGAEGVDLAIRPGYTVEPKDLENLPQIAKTFRAEGLSIPLVSAPGDLLSASDERAPVFLRAMAEAEIPLLKLGYFTLNPGEDYWEHVDAARQELSKWESLARSHGVTAVYHTHSCTARKFYLGSNASGLAHLIREFDPNFVGAYIDSGHLVKEGEPFSLATMIAGKHLRMVAFKEMDARTKKVVPAGEGDVNWDDVFSALINHGYTGALSVHAEFHAEDRAEYDRLLKEEVAFFRNQRATAIPA